MYKRVLSIPTKSFFLFGARGTGKSTWLRSVLKPSLVVDLLKSSDFLRLSADPSHLAELCGPLKPGSWVIIDEIQRVPELLNEVHRIYEEKKLHFALSGSSARKLKRGGANLLAGRALQRFCFPLVYPEYGTKNAFAEIIDWGALPLVLSDPKHCKETLNTYVETYLRQELLEEGLVRKLEPFARFLRIAGICNGQVLNVENISREAHVGRTTVDKYFEILEDTLLATRLYPYRPSLKVKELGHPKFYFFDSGVARACAGLVDEAVDGAWRGFALETCLLNELKAYNHYTAKNRSLYYYGVSGSFDIDFIVELKKKTMSQKAEIICIEVKLAKKWDSRWSQACEKIAEEKSLKVVQNYGVYLGDEVLKVKSMTVLPVARFLERLHGGEIF